MVAEEIARLQRRANTPDGLSKADERRLADLTVRAERLRRQKLDQARAEIAAKDAALDDLVTALKTTNDEAFLMSANDWRTRSNTIMTVAEAAIDSAKGATDVA
jgi:hypothetical protein